MKLVLLSEEAQSNPLKWIISADIAVSVHVHSAEFLGRPAGLKGPKNKPIRTLNGAKFMSAFDPRNALFTFYFYLSEQGTNLSVKGIIK